MSYPDFNVLQQNDYLSLQNLLRKQRIDGSFKLLVKDFEIILEIIKQRINILQLTIKALWQHWWNDKHYWKLKLWQPKNIRTAQHQLFNGLCSRAIWVSRCHMKSHGDWVYARWNRQTDGQTDERRDTRPMDVGLRFPLDARKTPACAELLKNKSLPVFIPQAEMYTLAPPGKSV